MAAAPTLDQKTKAVEKAGWDKLFDIGRVVVFSKKLESLLCHLMAAVAADKPDYLSKLRLETLLEKPTNNRSDLIRDVKRAFNSEDQLREGPNPHPDTVAKDVELQILLYKACKLMVSRGIVVPSEEKTKPISDFASTFHNSGALKEDSTDDSIRKKFKARADITKKWAIPVIELLRGTTPISIEMKRMIMLCFLSDWPLTLGNLRKECLPTANESIATEKTAKCMVQDYVKGSWNIDEIRKAFIAINKLRNDLVHYNNNKNITVLQPQQRTDLMTEFTYIVNCEALFQLIFPNNSSMHQSEYQLVITETEWRAVLDEYKKRLTKLEENIHSQGKDKEAVEEERDEVKRQLRKIENDLIEAVNKHAKLLEHFNDLVISEREARDEVQKNAELRRRDVDDLQQHYANNRVLLEGELDVANKDREELRTQLQTAKNERDQFREERDNLSSENDKLSSENDQLKKKLEEP